MLENVLLAEEVIKFKDFIKKNKPVESLSFEYDIYSIGYKDTLGPQEYDSAPNFKVLTHKDVSFDKFLELLREAEDLDTFYGAVCIDNEHPYNVHSVSFINKVKNKWKEDKLKKTVSFYLVDEKIDTKLLKRATEVLNGISFKDIIIDEIENDNVEIYSMMPREYEDYNMHGSDHHVDLNEVKSIYSVNPDFLWNTRTQEKILSETFFQNNSFGIELSIIDNGIIIPAFGLFVNTNNQFHEVIAAQGHPNISESGTNYCTGSQAKRSFSGIQELSYGNLNSPLNRYTWRENQLTIAKAFRAFYAPKLEE